jgi:hypothetical protein
MRRDPTVTIPHPFGRLARLDQVSAIRSEIRGRIRIPQTGDQRRLCERAEPARSAEPEGEEPGGRQARKRARRLIRREVRGRRDGLCDPLGSG